jgi:hypothetical protein
MAQQLFVPLSSQQKQGPFIPNVEAMGEGDCGWKCRSYDIAVDVVLAK